MTSTMTRRTLIGAAGTVAAATALAAGTALADTAAQGDAQATEAAATDELLYTAGINPQDSEWYGQTSDMATLFSPWTIGNLEIGHRMVKSAAGSATYLAGYTDELFQYYLNFAKGGVELIWVEGEAFTLGEDGTFGQEAIEFGKKLVQACAEYGSHLGYQWALFGSGVGEDAMTVEQIQAMEDTGAAYAAQLKEMGFEAIEINAAGFNQGEQFLSRYYNTRTDEYGYASPENRSRWVCETIQKIKAACGEDFIVQMLINCIEDNDNLDNGASLMTTDNMVTNLRNKVTTVEEGIAMAKCMEEAGADSMHLRLGPLGNHPCQFGSDLYFLLNGIEGATGYGTQYDFSKNWQGYLDGSHSGAGMLFDVVARYKAELSIPCGCVTYNDPAISPAFFEDALAQGKVDFFMMTRPLTVDPQYVNKLREGRIDEIAPCTRCLHCHIGSNQMNRQLGYCRVNALTQRVMTENGPASYDLEPAQTSKKVMVVGGGPAGMEAARIAALRGHDVTLYEKTGVLGGKLPFAATVKGAHENLTQLNSYLQRQCELAGVNVVLDTEVTADFINSEAPDALVLACGADVVDMGIVGEPVGVVELSDVLFADLGENVVVNGDAAWAFDIALWLTLHKKHVVMVAPHTVEELDQQQSQHAQRFMTTALYALGMQVYTQASITAVGDGEITVHSDDAGVDYQVPADQIVNANCYLANTTMLENVNVEEVYTVGDCNEPFNIAMAIRGGNDAGRAI